MQYVPAFNTSHVQGAPKNALSECCWSHSALAQTQVPGTLCEKKLIFWSFLAKTKPDQNVTIGAKFCSIAWDQIWAIFYSIRNISCDWARSFSGLTSANETEVLGGIEIPKMSQIWFFSAPHTQKSPLQSNWWVMTRENQHIKYCCIRSLTNLSWSNNSFLDMNNNSFISLKKA